MRAADVYIEDDLRLRADMDPNFYFVLTEVANAERLQHTTGGTRNVWDSLSTMRPLLFERELVVDAVPPGVTVAGYLPFYAVKPNAVHILLHIGVETPGQFANDPPSMVDLVFLFMMERDRYRQTPAM